LDVFCVVSVRAYKQKTSKYATTRKKVPYTATANVLKESRHVTSIKRKWKCEGDRKPIDVTLGRRGAGAARAA